MGRRLKLTQHDTLSSRQGCGEHGEPHGSGNHDRIAARRNSPIDVVFHWQLGRAARQPLAGALRDACTLWTVWDTRRIGMQRRTSRPCRRPRNTCDGIRGANPSHRAQLSAEMKRADLSISPWSRRVGAASQTSRPSWLKSMCAALARGCCASHQERQDQGDTSLRGIATDAPQSPRVMQDGSTRTFVAAGFMDPARIKRADVTVCPFGCECLRGSGCAAFGHPGRVAPDRSYAKSNAVLTHGCPACQSDSRALRSPTTF